VRPRGVTVVLAGLCFVAACDPDSTTSTGLQPTTAPETAPVDVGLLRGTIVFSAETHDGNVDVYVLHLRQGDPIRLTDDHAKEFDPDLSPDGTQIAYRRNPEPGSDEADIWVMDLDGGNQHNITNAPSLSNWAPAWTRDGLIAFSRMGSGGVLETWTMMPDGSDALRIAAGWCEYPQPSPDGSQFVCAGSVGGRYDIFIVTTGGERRAITATPVTEFGPAWSPDGEWIAFSRDEGDRLALMVIRPDGSGEREVAHEGAFPTWDPDGHLVWSGPGGINVSNPDGTGRVVLLYAAEFIDWGE
jgi:TolB protein